MEKQGAQEIRMIVIDHSTVINEDFIVHENEHLIICGEQTKVSFGENQNITFTNLGCVEISGEVVFANCTFLQNSKSLTVSGLIQLRNHSSLILGESAEAAMVNSGLITATDEAQIIGGETYASQIVNTGIIQLTNCARFVSEKNTACVLKNSGIIQKSKDTVFDIEGNGVGSYINTGMMQEIPG